MCVKTKRNRRRLLNYGANGFTKTSLNFNNPEVFAVPDNLFTLFSHLRDLIWTFLFSLFSLSLSAKKNWKPLKAALIWIRLEFCFHLPFPFFGVNANYAFDLYRNLWESFEKNFSLNSSSLSTAFSSVLLFTPRMKKSHKIVPSMKTFS